MTLVYDQKGPEYREIKNRFATALNNAVNNIRDALMIMADIVMGDLKQSFSQLFFPKWSVGGCPRGTRASAHSWTGGARWGADRLRSQATIKTLCATIDDYGNEVLEHMNNDWVVGVMQAIRQYVEIQYVENFLTKRFLKVGLGKRRGRGAGTADPPDSRVARPRTVRAASLRRTLKTPRKTARRSA